MTSTGFAANPRIIDVPPASVAGPDIPSDQPPKEAEKQQAEPDYRGTHDVPVIVKQLPRERSEREQQDEDEKRDLDRKLTDYTGNLAFYTKLLVFFTAALAVVTGWLAYVASRQMKEARKSIVASVDAAEAAAASASAADRHIVAVETDSRLRLRAYVQQTSFPEDRIWVNDNQLLSARVGTKNTGQTPAYEVEWRGAIHPGEYPLVSPLPEPTQDFARSRIVIHPNQDVPSTVTADRQLTADEVYRIQTDPGFRLYLYGYLTYRDIFGEEHTTEFRFMNHTAVAGMTFMVPCYDGNTAT